MLLYLFLYGSIHTGRRCHKRQINYIKLGLLFYKNTRGRNVKIKVDYSASYLEKGMWLEGWKGYDYGLESGHRTRRNYHKDVETPLWKGEKGHTVVIYGVYN